MVVAAALPASKVRRELVSIAERLGRPFGRPQRRATDPLDELIGTVLSQNTSDLNSGRAFRAGWHYTANHLAAIRHQPASSTGQLRSTDQLRANLYPCGDSNYDRR